MAKHHWCGLGKFPQMTWQEAMTRFGSDKPDLRNPLELVDVADIVKDVEFKYLMSLQTIQTAVLQ